MTVTAGFETAFAERRRARLLAWVGGIAVLVPALIVSAWISEATPHNLAAGLPRVGEYFVKLAPDLHRSALLSGPTTEGSVAYWFYRLDSWAWLLFETSQMAALATLGGAVLALLACFPAAANLAPNRATYVLCRRGLELFRTVPDIVYALILVWAVGVGPLAGILAIMAHTVGALGKLFAEVVENADLRPLEGIKAAGGSWLQGVRYAILPQVAPNFISYVLLRFEINVRGATVIGFVGAGGIGQELYTVISFNYYQEISAILVLILLSVSAIDLVSERIRMKVIG
ncbi:MAG: phosphonate ABC transporter, permease protein PhnE [Janthinobacterium lividum]